MPDYMAVTKMAINSTINERIQAPLKVFYDGNISLPVDLLLSKESSINPQAHNSTSKMKQLVYEVKCAMHDVEQAQKYFNYCKH